MQIRGRGRDRRGAGLIAAVFRNEPIIATIQPQVAPPNRDISSVIERYLRIAERACSAVFEDSLRRGEGSIRVTNRKSDSLALEAGHPRERGRPRIIYC